jgi:hypothetical protein
MMMKQETGVPSELYSTYDFSDLAWANPADPSYDIALVYLATKCAVVAMPKNTFYVLDRHSGFWVPTATQKLTANTLAAQYCGQFTHTGMSSTGIGKGTLMRLIRMVFNTGFSKYSEGDLQRDWNDFLEGVLVLEADEFKGQKKIDFSNMLKRDSTNNLITINKRGCSPRDIPNTANWIMTSNDEHPLIIEEMDRRNMFIHTSIDVDKWRPYSLDLNRRLDTDKSYAKALPGAFAAVLALIPVDYQLLSIAPHTALRAINRKASQNALEQWLYEADDGDLFGFERDTWLEAGLLFQRFEYYREKFARSSKLNSIAAWGREMSALARADRIKKDDRKGYKPRYFIPSKNYPLLLEEDGSYAEDPIVTRMNEWKKTRK